MNILDYEPSARQVATGKTFQCLNIILHKWDL